MEKLFAIILLTLISVVEIIFMLSGTMLPAAAVMIALILLLVCLMIFRLSSRHFWKMMLYIFFIDLLLVFYLFLKLGVSWQLVLSLFMTSVGILLSARFACLSNRLRTEYKEPDFSSIPRPPQPETKPKSQPLSHASELIEKSVGVKEEKPLIASGQKPAAKVKKSYSPGKYLASRQGKQYHLPRCYWAKKIRKENQLWFATPSEAEKKGYTKHNCIKK